MTAKSQPEPDPLTEIWAQLTEIKQLLGERHARPSDLVDTAYVARRTGLKEKSVMEGKAGTSSIPRVMLGRLVRYPRGEVDRFVERLVKKATDNLPENRVRLRLTRPRRRRA